MVMVKGWRRLLAAAVFLLVLAACTSTAGRPGPGTGTAGTPAGSGPAAPGGLRAVRHVWVIELENKGYTQSFGTPSADPYLARTLPRIGALLENYYAIGHSSAANYVAQVSGQAPDLGTQSDCPLWVSFAGQIMAGPYHQVLGEGCVYPAAVQTLGNQLSAAGRSWAAYLQDMGNDPARDTTVGTARGAACGHPATWAIDHTQKAAKGDQYAARHDGFTFFRSVTGNQAYCDAHILSFRPLPGDLARASATPAFSFLAPNLCNDGHDAPCADGAPGGGHAAGQVLRHRRIRLGAAARPGIGGHPGLGRLQGRRLGLVDGIAGEVDRVSGVGLGPLGPPLGGLCVKIVPLLPEPGPNLLELLLHVGAKASPRRGQIVLHLGAMRLQLLAPPLGGGPGLGGTSLELLAGLVTSGGRVLRGLLRPP